MHITVEIPADESVSWPVPAPTPEPTPPTTPTTETTVDAPPPPGDAPLPRTGADLAVLVLLAALFLAVGAVMIRSTTGANR